MLLLLLLHKLYLFHAALPQVSSIQLVSNTGTSLTINCSSTGSPALNVIWTKDGTILANSTSYTTTQMLRDRISATYDNLLDVNAAPSELVGVFSCIVHDSLGRNSQEASVQVNGKLCRWWLYIHSLQHLVGLQISNHSNHVNVGDFITVTCSFDLSLTSMEWLCNNEVVMRTTAPQLTLTFSPVNDTINGKQYTCRVITSYGVQEENITLRVQGNHYIVI